ncbi:125aa long hypothetical protein [Pyrococcus horikoshii OT3]|uniref:Uncharacterized protein n=1 Tax=Pyrococcus horikoshii (strain ATCC 700860 / DSM 12428 / JCM 9974 / NBRC 100139 / OT-3) TaxID=70601 RepID=O59042_PYRHO|nr:125aa long hypothetical protein [Pyrococcus horikoshii OT3]
MAILQPLPLLNFFLNSRISSLIFLIGSSLTFFFACSFIWSFFKYFSHPSLGLNNINLLPLTSKSSLSVSSATLSAISFLLILVAIKAPFLISTFNTPVLASWVSISFITLSVIPFFPIQALGSIS